MFNAGSLTGFVQTLGFTPKLWQFELAATAGHQRWDF
jgi:hypothetical protein